MTGKDGSMRMDLLVFLYGACSEEKIHLGFYGKIVMVEI